ncbi:MAG TPA: addiction module antidote protein [Acidiphilium sp.]
MRATTGAIGKIVMVEGAKTMKDRSHDEAMAELFREDPATAAATLDAIFADGDQGELLVTLRQMAKAFGGIAAVARAADLNPTQLYRTLSEKGNPELRSLNAVLHSMGLRLAVEPLNRPVPHV